MPEISTERLEQLELASKQLRWLTRLWCLTTGDSTETVLAMINESLDRGIGPDAVHEAVGDYRRRKK